MANRMPSFLALLGLAAAAGYQNRDALTRMLGTVPQVGRCLRPIRGPIRSQPDSRAG